MDLHHMEAEKELELKTIRNEQVVVMTELEMLKGDNEE